MYEHICEFADDITDHVDLLENLPRFEGFFECSGSESDVNTSKPYCLLRPARKKKDTKPSTEVMYTREVTM